MKFSFLPSEFKKHLTFVSKAIPTRIDHPILACVKLTADSETQTVTVSTLSLTMSIQSTFSTEVEGSGSILVNAKELKTIVSKLAKSKIIFSVDGLNVALGTDSSKIALTGMDDTESPETPTLAEDANEFIIDTEVLAKGFSILPIASTNETHQGIYGVRVRVRAKNNNFEFAATNGHHLAVVGEINTDTPDVEFTVFPKCCSEVLSMLKLSKNKTVTVSFDDQRIRFTADNQTVTSLLNYNRYPDYQKLFPKHVCGLLTVNQKLLSEALNRIKPSAEKDNNIINLTIDANSERLKLWVDKEDSSELLPVQYTGEDITVRYDIRYLFEGVKLFSGQFNLMVTGEVRPTILKSLGGDKIKYLITPVKRRDSI